MEVAEAHRLVSEKLSTAYDKFYGSSEGVGLGAGLIYGGIRYPVFDPGNSVYVTQLGIVFVLTHECDVDPENSRPFHDDVLICPVIGFAAFVEAFTTGYSASELRGYLGDLGRKRISQLVFIPSLPDQLPYGGVPFLNQITHTKVDQFSSKTASILGAVSAYGLEEIDLMLRNHLGRKKADRLSFYPPD